MGRDPGMDEGYLESMRDAGRDPWSGHHLGERTSKVPTSAPVFRSKAFHDADGVDGPDARLCPSCGLPDLRVIADVGPGGHTYAREGCVECGWASDPVPD